MAQRVLKIRMNSAGAIALLKDPGVAAFTKATAESLANTLPTSSGEEWEVVPSLSKDRTAYLVRTANRAAETTASETVAMQAAAGGSS